MKSIFFIPFLLLLWCNKSFAQQSRFEFGLHTGLNLNTARGNAYTSPKPDNLLGVHFGFDVDYKLSERFRLKAMPQLDVNGWAFRSLLFEGIPPDTVMQKGSAVTRLVYLNLPMTLNYSFGNKIEYNFGVGVFCGLLSDEKLIINQKVAPGVVRVRSSEDTDNYKRFNFGLSISANAKFPISQRLKLNIGLLENLGLANINRSGERLKTQALSAMCGVIFQPK